MRLDRSVPEHVQYYQHLADIIFPMWEVFARRFERTAQSVTPLLLPSEYILLVAAASKEHAYQFLTRAGYVADRPKSDMGDLHLGDEFMHVADDPFISQRILEVVALAAYTKIEFNGRYQIERALYRGLTTGFDIFEKCLDTGVDVF